MSRVVCVLAMAILFCACGTRKRELVQFTQCFGTKDELSCATSDRGPNSCQTLVKQLSWDEAQGCYGLRWSMPKNYHPRKFDFPGRDNVASFAFSAHIDGVDPSRRLPRRIRNRIVISPLPSGSFASRMTDFIERRAKVNAVQRRSTAISGLDAYVPTRLGPREMRVITFVPENSAAFYATCIVKHEIDAIEKISPRALCYANGNVDDLVRVLYPILYSDLWDIFAINDRAVSLTRGFMLPVKHAKH